MMRKSQNTRAKQELWNSLAKTFTGHSNEDTSTDMLITATHADKSSPLDMRHSDS